MDEEDINYRFLRKIQQLEKKSPKLSDITDDFYSEVLDYIKDLDKRLKNEDSKQKQRILEEEIDNTKKIFFSVYEFREKKIILAAMSKARSGKPAVENMIDSEKELFNNVLETIKNSREKNLSKKNETKVKEEEKIEKKEEKGNNNDLKQKGKDLNPIVRVKKDIPEFVGTDKKKYKLKKDDVLTISEDMCDMLSKRKACEKIEI